MAVLFESQRVYFSSIHVGAALLRNHPDAASFAVLCELCAKLTRFLHVIGSLIRASLLRGSPRLLTIGIGWDSGLATEGRPYRTIN